MVESGDMDKRFVVSLKWHNFVLINNYASLIRSN